MTLYRLCLPRRLAHAIVSFVAICSISLIGCAAKKSPVAPPPGPIAKESPFVPPPGFVLETRVYDPTEAHPWDGKVLWKPGYQVWRFFANPTIVGLCLVRNGVPVDTSQ